MMLRLILHDRAFRRLLPWLPIAVLIGFLLSTHQQDAVRHGLTVGTHGYQGFRYVAYLPWGVIGSFLLYAGVALRCERLGATLPLSFPTLWLSRVLALLLSAWGLVGAMAFTVVLRNRVQGFEVVGRTQLGSLFAQLVAVSALAVALARLPRPALQALAHKPGTSLYFASVWLGLCGVVYLLAGAAPGYALLPGLAAAGLGLTTYVSLPKAPLVAPRQPAAGEATRAQARLRVERSAGLLLSKAGGRWPVRATIARVCCGHWGVGLVFVLLLLLGFARSDVGGALTLPGLLVVLWLLMGAFFAASTSRLYLLDALPVSRRHIFDCAVLPALLVVTLGYLGTSEIQTMLAHSRTLVDYRRHPVVGQSDVLVPFAYWEIGWSGDPPPMQEPYVAPWEEPYYPWSVTLYKGLSAVLYLPYHVPDGSSAEEIARQLGRAVEDVYGVRIPADEIERRYLSVGTEGNTALQQGSLALLEDHPGLKPTLWHSSAPLGTLCIGLPWLLYLALTVRRGYIRPAVGRKPWALQALFGLLAVGLLSALCLFTAGFTTAWKLNAFVSILARKLSVALPGSPYVQWGIVVLLYIAAYLLARSRFEGVEAPAKAQDSVASAQ